MGSWGGGEAASEPRRRAGASGLSGFFMLSVGGEVGMLPGGWKGQGWPLLCHLQHRCAPSSRKGVFREPGETAAWSLVPLRLPEQLERTQECALELQLIS